MRLPLDLSDECVEIVRQLARLEGSPIYLHGGFIKVIRSLGKRIEQFNKSHQKAGE